MPSIRSELARRYCSGSVRERLGLVASGAERVPTSGPFAFHLIRDQFLPDLHVRVDDVLESDRQVAVRLWVSASRREDASGWPAVMILGFDESDKIESVFGVQDTAAWLVAVGVLQDEDVEAQLERVSGHEAPGLDWDRPLS